MLLSATYGCPADRRGRKDNRNVKRGLRRY